MSQTVIEQAKIKVTQKNQLHQAKSELYPQMKELIDASLKLRGVSIVSASEHGCDEGELWRWVISQIID